MKILVTGSTGLVGTALVKALSQEGHTLCRLLRPQSVVAGGTKTGFDVPWNPATGELEGAAAGADAGGDLAGASNAGGRGEGGREKVLAASRVGATAQVGKAVGGSGSARAA